MVISEQRVIGHATPRADAPAKLSGQERYAGDLALAGLVHARPVLSVRAHARLVSVNREAALAVAGVVARIGVASAGAAVKAAVATAAAVSIRANLVI